MAFNQNLISVVDNAVHDCLGNLSAGVEIGGNACIPALGLVLGTKDRGILAVCFNDFSAGRRTPEARGTG